MSDLLRRIQRLEEALNPKQQKPVWMLFGDQRLCPRCGLEAVWKDKPEDCPRCKKAQEPLRTLDVPIP